MVLTIHDFSCVFGGNDEISTDGHDERPGEVTD